MKCRICNAEMMVTDTVNVNNMDVYSSFFDHLHQVNSTEIPFYRCPVCSHLQIENYLSGGYYDAYGLQRFDCARERIPKMRREMIRGVLKQLSQYSIRHDGILDIGCGSGWMLGEAMAYFAMGLGIEPSEGYVNRKKFPNIEIIRGYFNPELNLPKNFSAFFSTQVFEHVNNPIELMTYAYELLDIGDVGYINVPNGQKIMHECSYFDIFYDHLNYFTPQSLAQMAQITGFDVIKMEESFGRHHLDIYVRKVPAKMKLTDRKKYDQAIVNDYLGKYRTISIWGAGAKAAAFSGLINENNQVKVANFFDSNQTIAGKYIANMPWPIKNPTPELMRANDIIIIFASAYNEDIVQTLRQNDYKGDVMCLDGEIRIISLK